VLNVALPVLPHPPPQVVKQAYAASVLGDGGDRLVVHLVKHAISKTNGATATVPCLPKGIELEGNGDTITVGNTPRKGDDLPPAITDLRNDDKVQTFLKVAGNKIVADPDQDGSKCHTFMKEMFKEEQDEVGGKTKTFASLFKMHQTKYCGDHASMCTDNVEGVPEVDATKMTSFRAVNSPTANTPTVVFNSLALDANLGHNDAFKVLGEGETTFSFKALKTVMKKVCDKATNVVTKKAGLDKYGLPGPCAVATEVVLVRKKTGPKHNTRRSLPANMYACPLCVESLMCRIRACAYTCSVRVSRLLREYEGICQNPRQKQGAKSPKYPPSPPSLSLSRFLPPNLPPHTIYPPLVRCYVKLIEGIFGEDGAKMIENILPVKSSWTKTAANYVFDMEENEQGAGKHLREKTWSAMAFDGKNTHKMEDAKLADREESSGYALFQRIRKNKKVRAAAIFGAGITSHNVGGPEGENKKEAVAQMKQRLRAAGHRADGSP
jgi:hypothetical protein